LRSIDWLLQSQIVIEPHKTGQTRRSQAHAAGYGSVTRRIERGLTLPQSVLVDVPDAIGRYIRDLKDRLRPPAKPWRLENE
jgi:hypothetical protein